MIFRNEISFLDCTVKNLYYTTKGADTQIQTQLLENLQTSVITINFLTILHRYFNVIKCDTIGGVDGANAHERKKKGFLLSLLPEFDFTALPLEKI